MVRGGLLLVASSLFLLIPVSWAGQYNKKLNIGDPAPAWTDLPGIDGRKHSLADLKDKDVVVVVFTCNSCPIAVDYEDRIIAFTREYAGPGSKVAVVAINVNTIEEDRLPKMQERAKEKGFNFPYLYDETQKIARDFGASYTPEFFVLDKARRVVYMGAMDDTSNPANVKVRYLEEAVKAVLKGERPQPAETLARGCAIRYARTRR
ncbi:MAG: thioredoxin family protein [Gemmataceae bacterium]|nr:thioredoxin family protein [Gemmataceae bacterium]MDW8266072.1 thioredoxin family protein [Gemmataceae bacterium]